MADRPDAAKEQSQGQAPSTQANAPEAPVLQTPLNEERAKKRDRQEETPTGAFIEQQAEKRQRLNPYAEEEFIEETTGNQRGEETTNKGFLQVWKHQLALFSRSQRDNKVWKLPQPPPSSKASKALI